MLNFDF
jgi:hypothetical protein